MKSLKTARGLGFAVASLAVACGSSSSTPGTWTCGSVEVPNGSSYQCTSTDPRTLSAAAALGTSYTCPSSGSTTMPCPPPAEDAPPPSDDAGPPAVDTPPPSGSGSAPDAGPPAEDTPPPSGSGSPDAGAPGEGSPGSPGSPGVDLPDASENGGPPGQGNGQGNPHQPSSGSDSGTPCDPGTEGCSTPPTGGTPGSDAGPPSEGSNPPGGDAGAPPYDCNSSTSELSCTQPPSCSAGTHPSACGACVPNDTTEDCVSPGTGGCWVTGGGWIAPTTGSDSFGGNAMPMKSGTIRGQWENVDHGSGQQMHGEPSYLYCRHVDEPGPGADNGPHHNFTTNQAYFGGPARLYVNGAWSDGYWFDVVVDDHGEGKGAKGGGPDTYHITIRKLTSPGVSGAVVYDGQGNLSGGNIQLHPPNDGHPYSSSALPSWVSLQP